VEDLDTTNISLVGLLFIGVGCALILLLPRRYATAPIIICSCYMTLGQVVVVSGLHFTALRILIAVGLVRVFVRREYTAVSLSAIDMAILWWLCVSLIVNTLLWQTQGALINRLGFTFNALGLYFIFRSLVRDMTDILRFIKVLVVAIIPLTILMLTEYATSKNLFSILGGVPEYSSLRDGIPRCQGPFRHPILAGTFGATQAVIIMTLWLDKRFSRVITILGYLCSITIVYIARSSGALLAFGIGTSAAFLWYLRNNMRVVRWSILCGVIILHLTMNAPVWYIFARTSDMFGGGGWHRSYLIDQAVSHFGDWWLLGTMYTGDWMPYALELNPNSADITNQFLIEGINGGLITMILFISIIVYAFRTLGIARKHMQSLNNDNEKIVWLLGATLLSHVGSFLSVPYFDQIIVYWYFLLASIAALDVRNIKSVGD
jgi:hypothetical protein